MAEREGFEPPAPCGVTGFQDQLHKPLGHLSSERETLHDFHIIKALRRFVKPLFGPLFQFGPEDIPELGHAEKKRFVQNDSDYKIAGAVHQIERKAVDPPGKHHARPSDKEVGDRAQRSERKAEEGQNRAPQPP